MHQDIKLRNITFGMVVVCSSEIVILRIQKTLFIRETETKYLTKTQFSIMRTFSGYIRDGLTIKQSCKLRCVTFF